jgi:hypothetical protein
MRSKFYTGSAMRPFMENMITRLRIGGSLCQCGKFIADVQLDVAP